MNIILNFLIDIISYFKNFFKEKDYKIHSRSLEYFIDHKKDFTIDGVFWENEYDKWCDNVDNYYVDLIDDSYARDPLPENVTKCIIRTKYWYNNKIYKYISYDIKHVWPPKNEKCINFSLPLVSAQLLNDKNIPVKDILNKINRYAGHRKDFNGNKIKISDMLYYDEETLKNDLPKIKLVNILKMEKIVSTVDGYITDLQIP